MGQYVSLLIGHALLLRRVQEPTTSNILKLNACVCCTLLIFFVVVLTLHILRMIKDGSATVIPVSVRLLVMSLH